MTLKILLIILFPIGCLFSFVDRIPVPEKSADIDDKYIITDPLSGANIACNQILVVFQTNITRQQQEKILSSIDGSIIGGIPSLDLYQISIPNLDCSAEKVIQICERLRKNLMIVVASPRKENDERFTKVNTKTNVKRKSSLEMEATDRVIVTEDTNSINRIMEKKKQTLSDCQKQIRKFHPKKHGELLFRIYVSPIGKVSKVKTLKSDLKDHKIINCFEYKMGTWDGFPEEDVKFERQVEFTFKY